ncbi:DUF3139 domain-containing protein [Evansella clarkii]|uniref:DUF3139 domain-containing protein n=1 Tax=Evansella clarkii TaxID=79879 RepID=UPI000B439C35|nr:DUF3139 domain-containing protein [Evansella clarkii]
MNKKKKIFIIILWVFVIGLILTPFLYVEVNKAIYKHRVMDYLIEEKDYEKDEIQSVKGVWGLKAPAFFATVVFKNEPYVEYTYFAHNEVIQFEYEITEEGIQKGIVENDLINYESRY